MEQISFALVSQVSPNENFSSFVKKSLETKGFVLIKELREAPATRVFEKKDSVVVYELVSVTHSLGELRSYVVKNPTEEVAEIFLDVAREFLPSGYTVRGLIGFNKRKQI